MPGREGPPPPVTGLLETALYVADLERSRDFYADLFGFRIEVDSPRVCAFQVADRQLLLLFPHQVELADYTIDGEQRGRIPGHHGAGNLHFAFAIDATELAAWENRLTQRAIAIEERVAWKRGGTSIYFRDPDGHVVELATPGLWSFY